MSNCLQATPIILTAVERGHLEGLARSTKTEVTPAQAAVMRPS